MPACQLVAGRVKRKVWSRENRNLHYFTSSPFATIPIFNPQNTQHKVSHSAGSMAGNGFAGKLYFAITLLTATATCSKQSFHSVHFIPSCHSVGNSIESKNRKFIHKFCIFSTLKKNNKNIGFCYISTSIDTYTHTYQLEGGFTIISSSFSIHIRSLHEYAL